MTQSSYHQKCGTFQIKIVIKTGSPPRFDCHIMESTYWNISLVFSSANISINIFSKLTASMSYNCNACKSVGVSGPTCT